ncbi:hypothetical protein TNCV_319081 [Trichonephila clavipes]|nr:hypothetical protein TNCV_319081 [Trichonephila clavipes]
MDFDKKKSLATEDSQIEEIPVDEGNLGIYLLKTELIVVADAATGNSVESIVGGNVACAVIRDLILSFREQLIEEQRRDPELGHIQLTK